MRPQTRESESSIDLRESTRALQALLAVAAEGSFVGAATRLGITPSGVSKIVTRAEARFGTRLVRRTTRKLSLTDVGRAYVARGQRIVDDLRALDRELSSRDTRVEGNLRVAAPTVYGPLRIAPILARLQRAHPRLGVELLCSDRRVDLVEEGIDVAVRMTATPPLDLVAREIEDDRRGLFASARYVDRKRPPATASALARHRLLHYGTAPDGVVGLALGQGGATTVSMKVAFSSDSVLAVKRATMLGLGIAVLPTYLVRAEVARGKLVELLPGAIVPSRKVYAITHPGSHMPARVRAFLRYLSRLRPRSP